MTAIAMIVVRFLSAGRQPVGAASTWGAGAGAGAGAVLARGAVVREAGVPARMDCLWAQV